VVDSELNDPCIQHRSRTPLTPLSHPSRTPQALALTLDLDAAHALATDVGRVKNEHDRLEKVWSHCRQPPLHIPVLTLTHLPPRSVFCFLARVCFPRRSSDAVALWYVP